MILRYISIILLLVGLKIVYAKEQAQSAADDKAQYYRQIEEAKKLVLEFEKNFLEMILTENMENAVMPQGQYTAEEGMYYRQFARIMVEKVVEKLQENNEIGPVGGNLLSMVEDILRMKYGISTAELHKPDNINKTTDNIEKKPELLYNNPTNMEDLHGYKKNSKRRNVEDVKNISRKIRSRQTSQ